MAKTENIILTKAGGKSGANGPVRKDKMKDQGKVSKTGKRASNNKIFREIILSDSVKKPESQMTSLEKRDIARAGITKRDLEALKSKSGLDYDELATTLSVTRATLINKKGSEKFSSTLSERIISLADIYSFGYAVFEDIARFNRWISTPNQALGGKMPIDIMDNQFGREEIRNIIGRINYGVYS